MDPDDPTRMLEVSEFSPPNAMSFQLLVTAFVGEAGDDNPDRVDAFDFVVCTPTWLDEHPEDKGFRWGHGLLIVPSWDYAVVYRAIRDLCLHTEGKDWNAIGIKLAHFTNWEFEYRLDARPVDD
jgi:hypothetical protein